MAPEEIRVNFVICTACDEVFPVTALVVRVYDFETDEGDPLVVHDYHCPNCMAKLAAWGTT